MEIKMIKKEEIEKALGYEINGELRGLSARVVPKTKAEFIDLDFQVLLTGTNFEDFNDGKLGENS